MIHQEFKKNPPSRWIIVPSRWYPVSLRSSVLDDSLEGFDFVCHQILWPVILHLTSGRNYSARKLH